MSNPKKVEVKEVPVTITSFAGFVVKKGETVLLVTQNYKEALQCQLVNNKK